MASPGQVRLSTWFPNVQGPVIVSAPMLNVSNGTLAAQVSKAGGVGMVQGGHDFSPARSQMKDNLTAQLQTARAVLGPVEGHHEPLSVGVGFILSDASVKHFGFTAMPILHRFRVPAAWLFASDPAMVLDNGKSAQQHVIDCLHDGGVKAIVQVGTVAAAREAMLDGADAIVAQGMDAGGHQFARGAGVISLVPEIRTMLDDEFGDKDAVLLAAGGIVEGRGVAAALALGAEAVVMGTRFILAKESTAADYQRKAILESVDGGTNTVKSTFHDILNNTSDRWPAMYDGRAIVGDSFRDYVGGEPVEKILERHKTAKEAGQGSRLVTWAGTGVGLVKCEQPAAEIVREVREEARKRVQALERSM